MVGLGRESVITSLGVIILFIYMFLETGDFFIAVSIPLLASLILKLGRVFLVYPLFVLFSVILMLYPPVLNLEHILSFLLFGMIPFIIIVEACMSYCSLKRIEVSLKGAFSALLPLLFILPLFTVGWRNFAFTSAEVITSTGIFYIALIYSVIISAIIFSESRSRSNAPS